MEHVYQFGLGINLKDKINKELLTIVLIISNKLAVVSLERTLKIDSLNEVLRFSPQFFQQNR